MIKMIQTIKENKTSIIIALVVGLFLFYSQPLLTFIGTQIVNLFVAVSIKFSNYYYSLVAQNDPNLISNYIASIIVLLYWFVVSSFFAELYIALQDYERELQNIEGKLKGIKDDLSKGETTPELEITQLQKKIQKRKRGMKMVIAISFLLFLYFCFKQGMYSVVNAKNVSFQNKLIVLSVHLSEDEIKQLKAKWVLMKSSDDYKQIIRAISDYETKYKIAK